MPARGLYNNVNLQVYHYAGNNPLKYSDPSGEWYFRIGVTGSAGAGTSVGGGAGVAIGYTKEKGLEIGTYKSGSAMFTSNVGIGGGLEMGIGTKNVSDMDGVSISLGGSVGEGVTAGGDVTISADGSQVEISGNVGFGASLLPAEGHITTTVTETSTINVGELASDLVNDVKEFVSDVVEDAKNTVKNYVLEKLESLVNPTPQL